MYGVDECKEAEDPYRLVMIRHGRHVLFFSPSLFRRCLFEPFRLFFFLSKIKNNSAPRTWRPFRAKKLGVGLENIENLLFYGKWKATLARNVHSTSFSHPDGETGETIPGSPISMQEHLIDVSTSSNKKRCRGVFRVRSGSEFATQPGGMTCVFFFFPQV